MARSGREAQPGPPVTGPPAGAAARVVTPTTPDAPATPDAVGAVSAARLSWRPSLPALVVGALCVIAGGLVAAVTGPLALVHGSWSAAYLVLVAGVAQISLTGGQAMLAQWARHPVGRRLFIVEFAGWNLGNVAVITGTLWGTTLLVNVGGALLVIALGALLVATRSGFGQVDVRRGRRVALLAVRGLVALLLVSIPIGLWLAHARAH